MGINSLEFNTKLTAELDKAVVHKSKTGFLADNNFRAKFVGAKTVMLPELDLAGAGAYDRDGDQGFVRGAVTVTQRPYELTMERARSFQIDREDADETGVANLAGQIATEFVRTRIVPEMDAYNLSALAKIAAKEDEDAGKVAQLLSAAKATLVQDSFSILDEALRNSEDASGGEEEMVAFVNPEFWAALCNAPEFQRHITVTDFKRGEVSTRVKSFNGCALIPVPGARMKSEYQFYDGKTTGQEVGGFVPADGAKDVYLILMPKKGASLVKKTEQTRIYTPKQNLNADAWKIDYRLYYDLLVKRSQESAIWAALSE